LWGRASDGRVWVERSPGSAVRLPTRVTRSVSDMAGPSLGLDGERTAPPMGAGLAAVGGPGASPAFAAGGAAVPRPPGRTLSPERGGPGGGKGAPRAGRSGGGAGGAGA